MRSREEQEAYIQAQLDEFKRILDDGWVLLHSVDDIERRYRNDKEFADTVPRSLMYWDIGVLIARVHVLMERVRELEAVHGKPH